MKSLPEVDVGLLAADEPAPYRLLNADGASPLLLVCDHASNRVPRRLQNLGLPAAVLDTHIGWDPGAAKVAQGLAEKLDAPLLLSQYSRLVIDCNRPPQSPESIPSQSAGVLIPGNQNLSESDRRLRLESLFLPYQQAIAQLLQQPRTATALLSIHSFTPQLNGECRPWQIGVAYYQDARLAQSLFNALAQSKQLRASGWQVGFNQPYAIETEFDYTVPLQGEGRDLPCAMVEMRQDMIADQHGVQQLIDLLATAWAKAWPLLADADLADTDKSD
jgi:predicted N-formylglutamate amidohydrolase